MVEKPLKAQQTAASRCLTDEPVAEIVQCGEPFQQVTTYDKVLIDNLPDGGGMEGTVTQSLDSASRPSFAQSPYQSQRHLHPQGVPALTIEDPIGSPWLKDSVRAASCRTLGPSSRQERRSFLAI